MAILNPGGYFHVSDGSYHVPYPGLYQFTITFCSYTDVGPKFFLLVDGVYTAYMRNYDGVDWENSIIMTRNLHLQANQVITVDVSDIDGVYGEGGGADANYKDDESGNKINGYYSWFTGHLIYAD